MSVRDTGEQDAAPVLAWLAPRAIAGVEVVTDSGYARTLRVRGSADSAGAAGGAVEVVRASIADGCLEIAGSHTASAAMARVFDVDGLPEEHALRVRAAAVAHDAPLLAAAIDASAPLRQPGCADPHEMLFRAILGQQITVAAATQQLGYLATLGDDVETGADDLHRVFPTATSVAAGAASVLRGPAAKTATVVRAADALVDGSLDVSFGVDLERMRAQLIALKGIGPWTAGYVSLRLGDPDVLLMGDVAVRAGAKRLGITDLEALAAGCAGGRSHLMLLCWRAASLR